MNFYIDTKAFMIKYSNEQIDINDVCHFRLDLTTKQKAPNSKITIQLLYADMDGYRKKQIFSPEISTMVNFKVVDEV